MNKNQKIVVVSVIALIVIMFIFPPVTWSSRYSRSVKYSGYSVIFDLDEKHVNVSLLLAQWFGVLICGGLGFYLAGNSNKQKSTEKSAGLKTEETPPKTKTNIDKPKYIPDENSKKQDGNNNLVSITNANTTDDNKRTISVSKLNDSLKKAYKTLPKKIDVTSLSHDNPPDEKSLPIGTTVLNWIKAVLVGLILYFPLFILAAYLKIENNPLVRMSITLVLIFIISFIYKKFKIASLKNNPINNIVVEPPQKISPEPLKTAADDNNAPAVSSDESKITPEGNTRIGTFTDTKTIFYVKLFVGFFILWGINEYATPEKQIIGSIAYNVGQYFGVFLFFSLFAILYAKCNADRRKKSLIPYLNTALTATFIMLSITSCGAVYMKNKESKAQESKPTIVIPEKIIKPFNTQH